MSERKTKVTDEQIIAGLLTHGTIKEAAEAVGVTERTIYNRMKAAEFQALYRSAKADLVRTTAININSHVQEAVNTIVNVMKDEGSSPSVRMQAAQMILSYSERFFRRLQDNETDVIIQQNRKGDSNSISLFDSESFFL